MSSAVAATHKISTTAFAAGHLSDSCQAPLREVWSRVARGGKPGRKLHRGSTTAGILDTGSAQCCHLGTVGGESLFRLLAARWNQTGWRWGQEEAMAYQESSRVVNRRAFLRVVAGAATGAAVAGGIPAIVAAQTRRGSTRSRQASRYSAPSRPSPRRTRRCARSLVCFAGSSP